MFRIAPPLELKKLEAIFRYNRYKVFRMLWDKEKITKEMISMPRLIWSWKVLSNRP